MTKATLAHLLTHSMMTPAERSKGRFMRAPDGHGEGGKFTQADIDAAVAKATGDVDGLKEKVAELIGDNKKLKDQVRRAGEIKPEDLAAVEKERDDLAEKLKAAEKAAKEAAKAAETATKALETESAFTQKLLIQDGLKSALISNGVKDEDFIDSLTAKFASGASIKADGDKRVAMLGDKPLGDAIKEWAGSDAGKKFIAAPVNSGGGAGGGSGGGSGKAISQATFDGMNAKERAAHFAGGGTIAADA
jgi:hypothetical protein